MTTTAFQSEIRNPKSAFAKLQLFAADIKISHTLFAMPFALLSAFLAAGGVPRVGILLLIFGCMVTARTVAMAANRLLDAKLDAINPRTARRAIPSGALSTGFYKTVLVACAIAFIGFTAGFWLQYNNPWPLILAVPVLSYISCYPLLKRFTRLCHYYLGGALALAPVCAWIAVNGDLAIPPLIIAAAVLTWTAGFDIIYACQDYESDLATGTFSVPAKIGIRSALWVARVTHVVSFSCLLALVAFTTPLGPIYLTGVALAGLLLIIEHALVKPHDLSKVNLAFFTVNGLFSLLLGTLGIVDVLI
jgi:4-hydroxybenzoate polyprenyltransferase